MGDQQPAIDIVVPVYNEEGIVAAFHHNLRGVIDGLPYRFRILYVNDGSTDRTAERLAEIAHEDARVAVIELSRNFGHQAALTAGLDQAQGDYTLTMDGDGQHPPEMIPQMIALALSGYDIVLTQRVEPGRPSTFKRLTSDGFYRLINVVANTRMIPGAADFRLISRQVVEALRKMPEYHRFLRGMVAWVGYRSVILPYTQQERLGGRSKYTLRKMLKLALDATFSFSLVPLYVGISLGVFFLVLAVIEVIYVLSFWVRGLQSGLAPGWSSLMFMLLVVGGILMILMGFIGVYVGYIFQEVKHRPTYLIKSIWPHTE
jgi:glycosyltransferase involved in cell wall biosynthesis